MSNIQASETSQQAKLSPYPLILYALGSSIVSWKLKRYGSSPEGVTSLPVVSTTGIAAK